MSTATADSGLFENKGLIPPLGRLPLIIGGGFAAAAIAAGLIALDDIGYNVFPVDIVPPDWINNPGYQAPKVDAQNPGYSGETPDLSVSAMAEPLTPGESANVDRLLQENGYYDGLPGGQIERFVLIPEGYQQIEKLVLDIDKLVDQGLSMDEAMDVVARQNPQLRGPLLEFHQIIARGNNIILTTKDVPSVIRILSNGDVQYFVRPV